MTTAATDHPLADLAIRSGEHALRDHQPGQPYNLDAVDAAFFIRACLGIDVLYPARVIDEPTDENYCAQSFGNFITDMWGDIACYEAKRHFDPHMSRCSSLLAMHTATGLMIWEYQTTSGTMINLRTDRECADPHEATTCTVTIPAERDQPGRYAWGQVRVAMARVYPTEAYQLSTPTPADEAAMAITAHFHAQS